MTREEAAELLLAMSGNSIWEDDIEAITIAIDALRQVEELETEIDVLNWTIEKLSKKRPKGRWEQFMRFNTIKQCSICGCTTDCKPNYCPNCGADMKDGESND